MIDCTSVIFTHLPKDEMLKHYEWHKQKLSHLKVIWDIKDIPPDKFEDPKNPDILPMELENLWSNTHRYYTYCMQWFAQEKCEYFILMERDVVILTKDFEKKIIDFMREYKVMAAFPWLDSKWTNPTHPFNNVLGGITSKQWTLPALTVINVEALKYYGQSFVHLPDYWGEIRFPSVLADGGFHITANPYTTGKYFYSPPKGPQYTPLMQSMSKDLIKEASSRGFRAIHPVKDYSLLDFIKNEINEEDAMKVGRL